jgi:spore germination cell wall hydrolase CwlJ-like protein
MKRLVKASLALVGTLSIAGAALVGLVPSRGTAHPEAVTVVIPPKQAAALVEATTGANAAAVRATGKDAQLINASLPFTAAPLQAARAFSVADSSSDHRRALLCLTQAVYYEAGYEPIEGRRAVAQVVLNRMRHPAFPKSVCGVVYQGSTGAVCQFSFVCDGALYRRPSQSAWNEAEAVAEAALDGYVEKSVGEATHYHADYVAPRWAPMLAKVAKLGAHIFYRWPGAWGTPAAFTGRYVGEPYDPAALRPPLRQAVIAGATGSTDLPSIPAGPPIARAPNDVGGLLDTSKGWTLNIPGPSDSDSAAARIAAQQSHASSTIASSKAPAAAATAALAVVASR